MNKMLGAVVGVAAVVLSGCSITGKWSLASIEPEAARRDFDYASLTLQDDGTFYGEAQSPVVRQEKVEVKGVTTYQSDARAPGIQTVSGTYEYQNRTLTLRPHDGPPVPFDARMIGGNHLRLEKFWEGQKVKAVFDRVE